MRYVGNKRRLLSFINQTMQDHQIDGKIFCDLFAGTATVGNYFKHQGYQIISNDLLYCSYVQQKVKVEINEMPGFERIAQHLDLVSNDQKGFSQAIINYLNRLNGIEGFIYQNYSSGGTQNKSVRRLYYSDENAKKVDVIRETIEAWRQLQLINEDEFYVLLYALLDQASDCANTTATMSSFLKALNSKSIRGIQLNLPEITPSRYEHRVYCQDGLDLLGELDVLDVLYLDPPYTQAQYASLYHLLETIARWDFPDLRGISGKRDTASLNSALSSKREALNALHQIVSSGCYRHLLMSYSDDSLISHEALMSLFQQYGEVTVNHQALARYNTMSPSDPRYNARAHVEERLYYLKPYSAHTTFSNRDAQAQECSLA